MIGSRDCENSQSADDTHVHSGVLPGGRLDMRMTFVDIHWRGKIHPNYRSMPAGDEQNQCFVGSGVLDMRDACFLGRCLWCHLARVMFICSHCYSKVRAMSVVNVTTCRRMCSSQSK